MADSRILLAHGDGGLLTHELISRLFNKHFDPEGQLPTSDAAIIPVQAGRLAFSTDTFVVTPVVFPGGDIGKLAVCGTINDLAVSGAVPQYLSAAFILEEGLDLGDLEQLVASMARSAREAGVRVVTGDTKVVEKGNADRLYINTTGIGYLPSGVQLGPELVRDGDVLILNGGIGEHGIAVLSCRPGLAFATSVTSDCAALHSVIAELLERWPGAIRLMRDPSRGGLATTVNELAQLCRRDMLLVEQDVPVIGEVAGAAGMLGLDPLYLANEGKVVIIAAPEAAGAIVTYLRSHPLGRLAAVIGQVQEGRGEVLLQTAWGGARLLAMPAGGPLPRIC